MSKVKVALIGAGGMANGVHYPSLASFDDVQIVGLCDVVEDKLKETAEKFKIADTFTDYQQMLDKTKPDAVYALMPPHHLFDVAIEVLDRGHALFVEKPPAVTVEQTRALAKRATDKKVVTSVGFQRRYHPMVSKCWEMVKAKGRMHQVVSCFYKNQAPSEVHPYYRGAIDILRCDAIHAVDALRYFAQLADVRHVASEVRTLDAWYPVSFNSLVHFENDVVGILQANWRTGRRVFKFEFHGLGASAYANIDGEGTVWSDNQADPDLRTTNTEVAGSDAAHMHQGFCAQARAFIDAVKSGATLHNSMQDAVKTMELADLIYANAMNKQT